MPRQEGRDHRAPSAAQSRARALRASRGFSKKFHCLTASPPERQQCWEGEGEPLGILESRGLKWGLTQSQLTERDPLTQQSCPHVPSTPSHPLNLPRAHGLHCCLPRHLRGFDPLPDSALLHPCPPPCQGSPHTSRFNSHLRSSGDTVGV